MKNNGKETAKHLMLSNVVTASRFETVEQLLKRVYRIKPQYDNFDYVYILDENEHLLGVVSTKDLINAKKSILLEDIMNTNIATVRPSTDQERVANTAIKYKIKAVPVVDKNNIFLGVIPPSKIFNILQWESTEDILRFSGVAGKTNTLKLAIQKGPLKMSFLRLPSLLIGILGGILAASVMEFYEESLQSVIVLAFFVPVILYISAAVGTQTSTIFVRNIALENIDYKRYILKEIRTGSAMAVIIGVLMYAIVYFWHHSSPVALTVGFSLVFATFSATLLGIFIPIGLMAMKRDPAISGGPLATVIQDVLSLVIYFFTASLILF